MKIPRYEFATLGTQSLEAVVQPTLASQQGYSVVL